MLVEQVDRLDAEPPERGVGDLHDVLGPAVEAGLPAVGAEGESELGGDDHLAAERGERLADEFLVDERAVHLGGVEEGDAAVHGGADDGDAVGAVRGRTEAELSTRSDEFRTRWAAHDVRFHRTGRKQLHHPVVGALDLPYEAFELPSDPGLTMIVYTAEPASATQDALNLLASWGATADRQQAGSAHGTDRA